MRVTEGNTDLGGGQTLAGKLGDLLNNILRGGFEPRWGSAAVGEGRGRCCAIRLKNKRHEKSRLTNALAGSVHATHFVSENLSTLWSVTCTGVRSRLEVTGGGLEDGLLLDTEAAANVEE